MAGPRGKRNNGNNDRPLLPNAKREALFKSASNPYLPKTILYNRRGIQNSRLNSGSKGGKSMVLSQARYILVKCRGGGCVITSYGLENDRWAQSGLGFWIIPNRGICEGKTH